MNKTKLALDMYVISHSTNRLYRPGLSEHHGENATINHRYLVDKYKYMRCLHTFCFALSISASLNKLKLKSNLFDQIGEGISMTTYASFRLAKVLALSFGFFACAAAFFCAFCRSCSRWFPPIDQHRSDAGCEIIYRSHQHRIRRQTRSFTTVEDTYESFPVLSLSLGSLL